MDDSTPEPGDLEPTEQSEQALDLALGRLPMFPLPNVVMFPHALLPLHVVEERYVKMAKDILSSHRFLVVSLLIDGEDAGREGLPRVHGVAGVGEVVMAHELPDGRFNLVVRGRARVRIDRELPEDEPYRLVAATRLPDDMPANGAELMDADASLRALVGGLADAIQEGGELLRQVASAQDTPAELVDVIAAALVVDSTARQQIMETTDVLARIELVSAEVVAMTSRIGSPQRIN